MLTNNGRQTIVRLLSNSPLLKDNMHILINIQQSHQQLDIRMFGKIGYGGLDRVPPTSLHIKDWEEVVVTMCEEAHKRVIAHRLAAREVVPRPYL